MTKITRLRGYAAIKSAEREPEVKLCKYADPMEGAREGLTVAEARQIAREDEGLIFADIVEDVAKPVAEQGERAKHTPGPWKITISETGRFVLVVTPDEVRVVCNCGQEWWDEAQANAKLIAAAPELAANLTECVKLLSVLPTQFREHCEPAINLARALLAKINS